CNCGSCLYRLRCGDIPHAVGDAFEIDEMQGGNIIGGDVATGGAATQRHGRKEVRCVTDCAVCLMLINANNKGLYMTCKYAHYIDEMQGENINGGDDDTGGAETQRHGRKEVRCVTDCAECCRCVHANTKGRFAQCKLAHNFLVLRMHTERVPQATKI